MGCISRVGAAFWRSFFAGTTLETIQEWEIEWFDGLYAAVKVQVILGQYNNSTYVLFCQGRFLG